MAYHAAITYANLQTNVFTAYLSTLTEKYENATEITSNETVAVIACS